MGLDVSELVKKGGVFYDVEGSTPEEVYQNVTSMMEPIIGVETGKIYEALCQREKIMSTAVGNGIALPHARTPLIKDEEDQRIIVVFPKTPLDMKAPDSIDVSTMFILLSSNPTIHLQILSSLVGIFQNSGFRRLLEEKASESELLKAIKNLS